MSGLANVLEARAGFGLAAFFVTWLGIALLLFVAATLHVRLQRLERMAAAPTGGSAYGALVGRPMRDLVPQGSVAGIPRMVVFLSADCRSCARVLSELTSPGWKVPSAIAWTDRPPSSPGALPSHVIVLDDGPRISREFGIRVTPFAVVADDEQRIVKAFPIGSVRALRDIANSAATIRLRSPSTGRLKEVAP